MRSSCIEVQLGTECRHLGLLSELEADLRLGLGYRQVRGLRKTFDVRQLVPLVEKISMGNDGKRQLVLLVEKNSMGMPRGMLRGCVRCRCRLRPLLEDFEKAGLKVKNYVAVVVEGGNANMGKSSNRSSIWRIAQ